MLMINWKAEHNNVRMEVRGSCEEMPISVWPKHELTLFRSGKPKMVLRSETYQHSIQGG